MDGKGVEFKGAARLDPAGRFELFLGGGRDSARKPCISEPLKQYIREMFDFLMSSEAQRQIGESTLLKRRTSTGKSYVETTIFDGMLSVRLIRGDGEYATFIYGIPFLAVGEEMELDPVNEEPDYANINEVNYEGAGG